MSCVLRATIRFENNDKGWETEMKKKWRAEKAWRADFISSDQNRSTNRYFTSLMTSLLSLPHTHSQSPWWYWRVRKRTRWRNEWLAIRCTSQIPMIYWGWLSWEAKSRSLMTSHLWYSTPIINHTKFLITFITTKYLMPNIVCRSKWSLYTN